MVISKVKVSVGLECRLVISHIPKLSLRLNVRMNSGFAVQSAPDNVPSVEQGSSLQQGSKQHGLNNLCDPLAPYILT